MSIAGRMPSLSGRATPTVFDVVVQDAGWFQLFAELSDRFYEYFCLCEDLKAKPLPTLFAGIACQSPGRDPRHMDINSATFRNNVIQDYLDLIEFANGDPESSSWAAVRR